MNKFLVFACAIGVTAAAAAVSAAPMSVLPVADTGIEFVTAMTMTVAASTKVNAQPVSSSKVVSTLVAASKVTVLDKTSNGLWAHIQMGTVTGYVPVKALK